MAGLLPKSKFPVLSSQDRIGHLSRLGVVGSYSGGFYYPAYLEKKVSGD